MSTQIPPKIPSYSLPKIVLKLLRNPLSAIVYLFKRYGDIFSLKLPGNHHIIFINHPDYIKHVLKDHQENYSRGEAVRQASVTGLDKLLGNGIFVSDGEEWEEQHKFLKPLFQPPAIKTGEEIVKKETEKMMQRWASTQNSKVDVSEEIHLLMLSIMLHNQVSHEMEFDVKSINEALMGRMESSNLKSLFRFQFLAFLNGLRGKGFRYEKHEIYLRRLEKIAEELISGLVEESYQPSGMFSLMLEAFKKGEVSKKEIRDQFMNFVFAGFDTTAAAVTWILYHIALDQNLQDTLLKERVEAERNHPGLPPDQLDLPVLQQTIHEVLRLYPPVWAYARAVLENDQIGEYLLPQGSTVVISSFVLHRDQRYWKTGKKFDIGNFSKETSKGKNFVYIPFGQGKRMCIGKGMAFFQMQHIVSCLLKRFHFSLHGTAKPGIKADIIIKSSIPVWLNLKERI